MKIAAFEIENVKRVRTVALEPSPTGLTAIGGENEQGKTSILDAIAYALGGERRRPTNLQRDDSSAAARVLVKLDNGIVAERCGRNATLHVTDPTGQRAGQKLLDAFVEELALDLPKFLNANARDKARVLLQILGIGDQLAVLDAEEKAAYDKRTVQGQIADSKKHHAAEMVEHHDVPEVPISAAELVQQSQAVLQRNAERQVARAARAEIAQDKKSAKEKGVAIQIRVQQLRADLEQAEAALDEAMRVNMQWGEKETEANKEEITADESTMEIETKMAEIETTNAKVRANLEKAKAIAEAEAVDLERQTLTAVVEEIRERRLALLDGVDLPLPELSISDQEIVYRGKAWDCMSSAEQIRVGIAIVQRVRPDCQFVLLDGLEKMDRTQLAELDAWLCNKNLQAIATRVSSGDECTIIIEDGMIKAEDTAVVNAALARETTDEEW